MTLNWVRLVAVPLALLLVSAAPPPPEQAAADRIRGHVEFLASDELEGRETGSRGHAVAARYVASQFTALGLTPGGSGGGGWYQQVPFRRASHSRPPQVRVRVGNRTTGLANAIDVALQPSLLERSRSIDAPLVFVGYGLDEPRLGRSDFAGLDVRGKIVVALSGSAPGLPSEVAAHLDSAKAETAARRGAIGLVEIPAEATGAPRRFGHLGNPRLDWLDASGKTGASSLLRARMAMTARAAERLFDGARTPLATVRRQARLRRPVRGFELPARLSIDAASAWQEFSSPNVVGLLPGGDPRLAREHVVLMGHLDHLGVKEDAKPGEDRIYNGALDNAAGIATMLEAARELVTSGKRPRRSVLFIANTGEERGLLGADYFASHPTVPIDRIVASVNLDMPLLLYDFTDVGAFGADHSTVARAVGQASRGMGIAVAPDPMPEQSIFVRSDHYPFVRRGVPAVLLFTGYGNGGKARWDHFFDQIYHKPGDDLSQPINWAAGARYSRLNYEIVRLLADANARPLWYRGDYFGDRFAPGQPRAER